MVLWRDQMVNVATELYGMTGTFFTTGVRYTIPFPTEAENNPAYAQPAPVGDGDDEDLDDDEQDEEHLPPPDLRRQKSGNFATTPTTADAKK